MKNITILILIFTISVLFVFRSGLFTFFLQDDFILINHFSQNEMLTDIRHVAGEPTITHWRPIHNLYFLLAGNIFGKNYFFYHLLTFFIHIAAGYFIYKISLKVQQDSRMAAFVALVYLIHPVHFVSLYWISGAATAIGFLLFLVSFYLFLISKRLFSLLFFCFALLASEAMIVGGVIFFVYQILFKKKDLKFLFSVAVISVSFLLFRFLFLTPTATLDVYRIDLSPHIFSAVKYYFLKIAGLAEADNEIFFLEVILAWLAGVGWFALKNLQNAKGKFEYPLFFVGIFVIGLFPFILIPGHVSAHYMNISVWGFSLFVVWGFQKILFKRQGFLWLAIFIAISSYSVYKTAHNSWVTTRSHFAKAYVEKISLDNPASGSFLVFDDNSISSSQEAFYSLGTGEGIQFWFKEKNYTLCFTAFEKCDYERGNVYIFE